MPQTKNEIQHRIGIPMSFPQHERSVPPPRLGAHKWCSADATNQDGRWGIPLREA